VVTRKEGEKRRKGEREIEKKMAFREITEISLS
jgi:hypothetical protein